MGGASRSKPISSVWHAAPGVLLLVLLVLPLVATPRARAQQQAADCEEDPCACSQHADCWDFAFLSSGKHTRLGLETTLTWVETTQRDVLATGVLASYAADIYRTRGSISSHAFVFGAIGAGSAGTEGALALGIDFGVRAPISRVSGPVVRLGPYATLLGNDAIELAMLEPLRLSAGFQRLAGDTLLEGGLTLGMLGAGRHAAAELEASLGGSFELGHYLAVQLDAFRLDGRVLYVQPGPFGGGARLGLVRVEACAYPHPVALCGQLQFIAAELPPARRADTTARALYAGVTAGLSP